MVLDRGCDVFYERVIAKHIVEMVGAAARQFLKKFDSNVDVDRLGDGPLFWAAAQRKPET